jgi:Uma2 family endonuclease
MAFTAQQLAEQMPDFRELLSDEPEMESTQHYQQLALLVSHLEWHWQGREDFFIGANLTVYYSDTQLQRQQFRGTGFFSGARRFAYPAQFLGGLGGRRALPGFDY